MMDQQIDESVSRWFIVLGNVAPNVEYVRTCAPGQAIGHPSPFALADGVHFTFQFVGQLRKCFIRIVGASPRLHIGFGVIERGQNLHSPTLTLFPQRQCLPYRIFFALKSPSCHCPLDKCLLIGREMYLHGLRVRAIRALVKSLTTVALSLSRSIFLPIRRMSPPNGHALIGNVARSQVQPRRFAGRH